MDPREKKSVVWLHELNLWTVAKATVVVLAVLALARVALQLKTFWLLLAGALVIAALLYPLIAWLERHRVPRLAALAGTVIVMLTAIGLGLYFLYPMARDQAQQLANTVPTYGDRLNRYMDWLTSNRGPFGVDMSRERLIQIVNARAAQFASWVLNLATSLLSAVGALGAMLFLAVFLLLDRERIRDALLRPLPRKGQHSAARLIGRVTEDVGGYMIGVVVLGTIVGVVTGVGLALIGVPYPILIGVVAGILEAIPYLGPFVAGALAALAGLTVSPMLALWAVVLFVAVQQLEGSFLAPFVLSRYVRLSPFWVSLAILAGLMLAGIPGGILALPVAIFIHSLINELYRQRAQSEPSEAPPPEPKA